ncbi:MAG: hypothetical protein SGPRY_013377 [Prymnesium sp.]
MNEEPMLPGGGFSRRAALRKQRRIRLLVGFGLALTVGLIPIYVHSKLHSTAPSLGPAFPSDWQHSRHLVMVAGHAVLTSALHDADHVRQESSWFLEPFQHGQLDTMLQHVERGVKLAAEDNSSLLLFSGGESRRAAGPRSEALSYWEAAQALGWFGFPQVRERAHLEVQARDSFENLLFAVQPQSSNELVGAKGPLPFI